MQLQLAQVVLLALLRVNQVLLVVLQLFQQLHQLVVVREE